MTTITLETNVTEERIVQLNIPNNIPLGRVNITITFCSDEDVADIHPNLSAYELLLTMPERGVPSNIPDLATNHDDYLYGDL